MARSSFELGLRLTCEQVRIAQNNKDRLDSARSADGAWDPSMFVKRACGQVPLR